MDEFSYEQIGDPRTRHIITSVFMDIWDSKIHRLSLQNICDDLIQQCPDENIGELMGIFAKTYPSKKMLSR